MKRTLAALLFAALLTGCAGTAPSGETVPPVPDPIAVTAESTAAVTAPPETQVPTGTVPREILDAALEAKALSEAPNPALFVPEAQASGQLEVRSEEAVMDYSNTADGYVMVRYLAETDKRLKVRVIGPTTVYTYNLTPGQWTVFPLSDGSGDYQLILYRNTAGSRYAAVMSTQFPVILRDEFAPFLRPNQYVDYSLASQTVALGARLCAGKLHPLDKVAAVYDYVVANLTYDYGKAAAVESGYLPVLDEVLEAKTGICFDYAALMAAMLRSQGVPCKLVVGYAGSTYHAWISVWTEENGWVDGAIFFDGQVWKRMDPTFASSGHRSDEIMDFIEHGSYTVKYLY